MLSEDVEIGADRGEQLILAYHRSSSPSAADTSNWTWRGQDDAFYILGDIFCALRHAGDALGIDPDDANYWGEFHHDSELAEAAEEE